MGKRKPSYRCKKPKFHGNKYVNIDINTGRPTSRGSHNLESASARKLSKHSYFSNDSGDDVNMIFNINILFKKLEEYLRCACGESVNINVNRIIGLGCSVRIVCKKCKEIGSFDSCYKLGKNNHVFSINRRAIAYMLLGV